MAGPDDLPPSDDAVRLEEGPLAAFFDAERAERVDLPEALVAAVLADAGAVGMARRRAPPARRRRAWPGLTARTRPLGGWTAAALAASAALGFWAGALGTGADLAATAFWSDIAALESAAGGLDGFFNLAAPEG